MGKSQSIIEEVNENPAAQTVESISTSASALMSKSVKSRLISEPQNKFETTLQIV